MREYKKSFIMQEDSNDCGAACLSSVARYFDIDVNIEDIRNSLGIDFEGTNALSIVQIANDMGLKASGIHMDNFEFLSEISMPAIAHISKNNEQHFVVIYKYTKKYVIIGDPAFGMEKIPCFDFFDRWTGILIIFDNDNGISKLKKRRKNSKFVFLKDTIRSNKKEFFLAIFSTVIITIIGIISSFYFQVIIDNIVPNINYNLLYIVTIAIAVMYMTNIALNIFRNFIILRIAKRIDYKIVTDFFQHIINLPITFFENRKKGDILTRFSDTAKIRDVVVTTFFGLAIDVLMVSITGVVIYLKNPLLFFISFILVLFYILVTIIFIDPIKKANRKEIEKNALFNSQVIESLSGVETIKSFNIINYSEEIIYEKLKDSIESYGDATKVNIYQENIKMTIDLLGTLSILFVGTILVLKDYLTIGELVAFNILLSFFFNPIQRILDAQNEVQSSFIAFDRISSLLSIRKEDNGEKELLHFEEKIEIENLTFKYGENIPVLNDVFLKVKKGEKIAIVGDSGSGKTTLAKMLNKLYVPTKGFIKIDEEKYVDLTNESLRRHILYVPQESFFFQGSIYENMLLDKKHISKKEIINMAQCLRINEWIDSLPNKYDYIIEEDALNLSLGQKQKLGILRSMLSNPSVIILDESTSNLDSASEKNIMSYIFSEKTRTVILITHKKELLRYVSKKYRIINGDLKILQ